MQTYNFSNDRSQLNIIFSVIGTPRPEELRHLDPTTAAIFNNVKARQPQVPDPDPDLTYPTLTKRWMDAVYCVCVCVFVCRTSA